VKPNFEYGQSMDKDIFSWNYNYGIPVNSIQNLLYIKYWLSNI